APRSISDQRLSQAQTTPTTITARMMAKAIAQPLTRTALVVCLTASLWAISRLRCWFSWSEELIGQISAHVLAVVTGSNVASIDDDRPAALGPVSRLRTSAASAAQSAAAAAAMNTADVLHFSASSTPPTRGPTMEPIRPIPSAQPTPEARTEVG